LRGSKIDNELFHQEFSVKMTPSPWEGNNFLAFSPFIFNAIMRKEEGFNYSLDTINSGALLQKTTRNPTLSVL
jgi:hypothetical protein